MDLREMLDIENDSFPHPWNEKAFKYCLSHRRIAGSVAVQKDRVIGYMLYEFHPDRLHLVNLAVSFESRRQSVGKSMVGKLIHNKLTERRTEIYAEVSEWNDAGIAFLKGCGFLGYGVDSGHYDNGEDAYLFRFRKGGAV
jgi:ribosomal-protein-alanine N-acetyltransferase